MVAPRLLESAAQLLEAHRSAYGRYHQLLDAMRVALRAEDLELLAHLAEQATDILAAIERHQRLPLEVEQALASSDPDAEAVRQLVAAVRIEGDQARAGLQSLLERLVEQRATLLRALRALEGGGEAPGSPYREGPVAPNYLDTTG